MCSGDRRRRRRRFKGLREPLKALFVGVKKAVFCLLGLRVENIKEKKENNIAK